MRQASTLRKVVVFAGGALAIIWALIAIFAPHERLLHLAYALFWVAWVWIWTWEFRRGEKPGDSPDPPPHDRVSPR